MSKMPRIGPGYKKGLIALVVVIMVILLLNVVYASEVLYGDVNDDGVIDVKDAVLVARHVLNLATLSGRGLEAADVDGDGRVDVKDVTLIMQHSLNLIGSFPEPITAVQVQNIQVAFATERENINFPATAEATLRDGTKRNIGVEWEQTSTPAYNPQVQGNYEFKGRLVNLPSGVTNPKNLEAKAVVSLTATHSPPPPGNGSGPGNGETPVNELEVVNVQAVTDPTTGRTTITAQVNNFAAGDTATITLSPQGQDDIAVTGIAISPAGLVSYTFTDLLPAGTHSVVVSVGGVNSAPRVFTIEGDPDADLVEIRHQIGTDNNPVRPPHTVYTLAGDGVREFSVWYYNKSGDSIDAHTIRVNFYQGEDEVGTAVTETSKTLASNVWTRIATISPELDPGDYSIQVKIDYGGNGVFDFTSGLFSLYVGKINLAGSYQTFMDLNSALAAVADDDPAPTITLYHDVPEDAEIDMPGVTLDLNGFRLGSGVPVDPADDDSPSRAGLVVGSEASGTVIRSGVIDGNLTVSYDGVVNLDGVTITGSVVFDGVNLNNAELVGDYTIEGNPKYIYNSIAVENAGQLSNALMNQAREIFFVRDITQTAAWGNLNLNYDVIVNLGAHTLTLDGQDINFTGHATITAGVLGTIRGNTGEEWIRVSNGSDATIKGAAGNDANVMNIEDIERVHVMGGSNLTLSKVSFDEGANDDVEFDIETGNRLIVEEYVTANDVELTFIGGAGNHNFNATLINLYYGTVQGDGRIDGTGKIVIRDAQNYHFRGLSATQLLTIDLPIILQIITDTDDETELNFNQRNFIIANLELLQEVRANNEENVIVDDFSGGLVLIKGGRGIIGQGRFIGADGTAASEYRVVANRSYLSAATGSIEFEDMTMRQVAFNIAGTQGVGIRRHTFDNYVFVEYPSGSTLTVLPGGENNEKDARIFGQAEFGATGYTGSEGNNVGTFRGPGATLSGPGIALFSAPYTVTGNQWFTVEAPVRISSDLTISRLILHSVTYMEDDLTVAVTGDLRAGLENGGVRGRFVGTGQDNAVIDVRAASTLYNLTLTDIERLEISANTIIENHEDLNDTFLTSSDVGLDVSWQTQQETEFFVDAGVSLIINNTSVRLYNDEVLLLRGLGAIRGVGLNSGRFITNTGYVRMDEESNLILHGYRFGEIDLVFDLRVYLDEGSETRLGSVRFSDWVTAEGDAVLTVVNNKIANFNKGIDIEEDQTLTVDTAAITIPLLPSGVLGAGQSGTDPDDIRGIIRGNNANTVIRGGGTLVLGDLLKVDTITIRASLSGLSLEEDADGPVRILTFADVTLEDHTVDFDGWTLSLEGDVNLARVNQFPSLRFNTIEVDGDEDLKAMLIGHGNTVSGDGGLAFASSGEMEAEAKDVHFDIRETGFPYEVMVGASVPPGLVIFTDVSWSNRTTVHVIGTELIGLRRAVLRFEGSCGNHGGLRAWIVEATQEDGLERIWNLLNQANIDYYTITP